MAPKGERIADGARAHAPATDTAEALAQLNARYLARLAALWPAGSETSDTPSPPVEAGRADPRFAAREWDQLPYFALVKQHFLLVSEYWRDYLALLPLDDHERRRAAFALRQWLDAMAPSNFIATNPEVLKQALESGGTSLVRGFANFSADVARGRISLTDDSAFEVGRNLAITPGAVVYRNQLIELIQYRPTTPDVYARPLVIVPPCINKFYILDLQPDNSFVRWAVAEGHTLFMISWRNIPPELGQLTWDDYLAQGILPAIEAARDITRHADVNTVGFCVGGAMLASLLAVLAARDERTVASASFLTTMLDYAEPGDIGVYVSRALLASREARLMAGERVIGRELATAFATLRANDLIWNYVVRNYLKGETPPAFDLLYWNSDSTNLPGPMYVEYLRDFYLDNRLREPSALTMLGEHIDLSRITLPSYIYASQDDHIVPWRTAYRSTQLLGGERCFVLGASGHVAGVINPPAKNKRNYWTGSGLPADADAWFAAAQRHPGSWWTHWGRWIAAYSGARKKAPAHLGNSRYRPLGPAPGVYVKEAMM